MLIRIKELLAEFSALRDRGSWKNFAFDYINNDYNAWEVMSIRGRCLRSNESLLAPGPCWEIHPPLRTLPSPAHFCCPSAANATSTILSTRHYLKSSVSRQFCSCFFIRISAKHATCKSDDESWRCFQWRLSQVKSGG